MKKIFLFIALCAFALNLAAQKAKHSKIPDAVTMAFAKAYPNVKDIDWEREKGNYEAEFDAADGKEMSVLYDATGAMLETEAPITFAELPKAAQTALKGKKVKETARITNAKGVVTYEAELKRKDLMFDAQGNPVK